MTGLILPSEYQKQRRELAKDSRSAFAKNPTGSNQVWQLDFSEFETMMGGTWRIAGCRDWYSKLEHPFDTSPTANQHDAIAVIELALAEYERRPLIDQCQIDPETGELLPVVTDNGGPFRSLNFELFIMRHPELRPLVDDLLNEGVAVVRADFLAERVRRNLSRSRDGFAALVEGCLPAILNTVTEHLPFARPVIVGHSLGGQLALIAAAQFAPDVPVVLAASGSAWHRAFDGGSISLVRKRSAPSLLCSVAGQVTCWASAVASPTR